MRYSFCTLFDVNYLDRGLVMYESLRKHLPDAVLYVYAFDSLAYDALTKLNLSGMVVNNIYDVMDDELRRVEKERSRRAFCWTSGSWVTYYTLTHYDVDVCVYVDADIKFLSNPACLIEEMLNNNCSVLNTKHNFPSTEYGHKLQQESGTYCVQFQGFVNDERGLNVCKWWRDKCIESCVEQPTGDGQFGDQFYLEDWPERFDGVWVSTYLGAGIATWNVPRMSFVSRNGDSVVVKDRETGKTHDVIFGHFHGMKDLGDNKIFLNVFEARGNVSYRLVKNLWHIYVHDLVVMREKIASSTGVVLPMIRNEAGNQQAVSGKVKRRKKTFSERIRIEKRKLVDRFLNTYELR